MPGNSGQRIEALRAMSKLLRAYKEGHSLEEDPPAPAGVASMASKSGKAAGYALSQLDGYLHRGNHPIVKDMS
eukprot:2489803-Karenia_brevis.AAC.1